MDALYQREDPEQDAIRDMMASIPLRESLLTDDCRKIIDDGQTAFRDMVSLDPQNNRGADFCWQKSG